MAELADEADLKPADHSGWVCKDVAHILRYTVRKRLSASMNARQTLGLYGGLPASLTPPETVCSPCPRGPEELELPKICTTVLHISCTVITFLSITFRINNIWNRYHPLRMTPL